MSWRVARSLDKLLAQINATYPNRSKRSDGSIGDAAHASRTSDHNPWYGPGVVTARDFTHDPANGFDAHAFAERLRQARDPRIKYVISNGRIFSATVSPWTWRTYTGPNPHDKHVHVSVVADSRCDNEGTWGGVTTVTPVTSAAPVRPVSKPQPAPKGLNVKLIDLRNAHRSLVRGPGVKPLQRLLGVKADGLGGKDTKAALGRAQARAGLTVDHIFGPASAEAFLSGKGV